MFRRLSIAASSLAALAFAFFGPTETKAQFGLTCTAPGFAEALSGSNLSENVRAAIRATCAFNRENANFNGTFGKDGWSWDLLPEAKAGVAELTELANKAAELNFKTNDPRALGNIRNMYIRVGDRQRWLSEQEKKFADKRKKQQAAGEVQAPPAPEPLSSFVFVVFQDDVASADKEAFLEAYKVSILEGPNLDKSYMLHLSAPLPQNQLPLVLDSMKSQPKIVKTAFAK